MLMPFDKGQVGKFCELSGTSSQMGRGCSWEKSRETKGVGRGAEFLSYPVQAQQHLDVSSVMLHWRFPGSCCEHRSLFHQEISRQCSVDVCSASPAQEMSVLIELPCPERAFCWALSESLPLKWHILLSRKGYSYIMYGYWLDAAAGRMFVITLIHFSHILLNALLIFVPWESLSWCFYLTEIV